MERLNISVEAEGSKAINLTVDVDSGNFADGAAKEALKDAENYLRILK